MLAEGGLESRPETTLRIVLRSSQLDPRRTRHDIAFYSHDGTLLGLMEGVEMTAAQILAHGSWTRAAAR
jgi:hypothetical protein